MFSKVICVLAICFLQVYAEDDSPLKTFCGCMKDVDAAKSYYEKKYDHYFEIIGKIQIEWENKIDGNVTAWHNNPTKCPNKYYMKSKREIVYDMLSLCRGGTALRNNYDPIWRKRAMSNEQICSTIATKYDIMCQYTTHNLDVVLNNKCNLNDTWEKIIWKNYEECASKCTKSS